MHLLKAEAIVRRHEGAAGKFGLCLPAAEALQLVSSHPKLLPDIVRRERIRVITPCHETGRGRRIAVIAHVSVS